PNVDPLCSYLHAFIVLVAGNFSFFGVNDRGPGLERLNGRGTSNRRTAARVAFPVDSPLRRTALVVFYQIL
ncbi:MAG: hypothetical protein MK102_19450, partial [Fuerstiella sp.]|nr:hypothetical protein [Fuerstiella sp.]